MKRQFFTICGSSWNIRITILFVGAPRQCCSSEREVELIKGGKEAHLSLCSLARESANKLVTCGKTSLPKGESGSVAVHIY